MLFDHDLPNWSYRLEGNYELCEVENGIYNGHAVHGEIKQSVHFYPSLWHPCLLPRMRIVRKHTGSVSEISFHLAFKHEIAERVALWNWKLHGKSKQK